MPIVKVILFLHGNNGRDVPVIPSGGRNWWHVSAAETPCGHSYCLSAHNSSRCSPCCLLLSALRTLMTRESCQLKPSLALEFAHSAHGAGQKCQGANALGAALSSLGVGGPTCRTSLKCVPQRTPGLPSRTEQPLSLVHILTPPSVLFGIISRWTTCIQIQDLGSDSGGSQPKLILYIPKREEMEVVVLALVVVVVRRIKEALKIKNILGFPTKRTWNFRPIFI